MGLNPSKLSKQNRDELEFNYQPKSGRVSNSIPTDIVHEIASFMTLKDITRSFSLLCREIRIKFFLNPCSPHWKIINLSDEIMFGDSQMKFLIRNGVLINSDMIILRRTNITSRSLNLITKFIHKRPENRLSLIDIRGCYKISRKSKTILQRSKPSTQICNEKRRDHFLCTETVTNESAYIFGSSNCFNRIATHNDNIIYYGCNIMDCECDYCGSINVKMKSLMTMFGPFYLDVLVGTFKYEFFEESVSRPVVDCFRPIFGTSKKFLLSANTLNYVLKKLWKYRMVKSTDFELIYRKYIRTSLSIYEKEMNVVECYCDRYGPIFVLRNDAIGLIATTCKFGAIFTSFDRLTSPRNAIKACRWLSCYAHLDLVEIA